MPCHYSVLGIAAVACVEVVLASLWMLLSMVRRGAIFDERAFRWVGVISVAGLVAAVIVAALCVHVGEIDDAPGSLVSLAAGGDEAAFTQIVAAHHDDMVRVSFVVS